MPANVVRDDQIVQAPRTFFRDRPQPKIIRVGCLKAVFETGSSSTERPPKNLSRNYREESGKEYA